MKLRSLKNDLRAAVDLGVVLMIGIAFAGLRNWCENAVSTKW